MAIFPIRYAIAQCGNRHARIARAVQSEAARVLENGLGGTPASRSHSRGLVAVATGGEAVGIDIEYMDPKRPTAEIIRLYVDEDLPTTIPDFYRCWTFIEAHFKAAGDLPTPEATRAVRDGDQAAVDGWNIFHEAVGDDFMLCILWRDRMLPHRRPERVSV